MTINDTRPKPDNGSHHTTTTLRLRFLAPLVAATIFLVLTLTIGLIYFQSEKQSYSLIHERLTHTQSEAKDFYAKSVIHDVKAIRSIMSALRLDNGLVEVFKQYDRQALLAYTSDLFKELNREYQITHFYFNKPDRVNLLRLHAPERYGDKIDRITTIWAEKRQNTASGVELGVMGTFTLRVVSPWYDRKTGELVGYIELGMEVDHVLDNIRDTFGLDAVVVIYKEFLERKKWQAGMQQLGRSDNWDEFDRVVLATGPSHEVPTILRNYLEGDHYIHRDDVERLEQGGAHYWLLSMPIADIMGHDVATMILLADASSEAEASQQPVLLVGVSVFVVGSLLVAFFYWQAGRVGSRIEHDEKLLEQLATHDSLTGLYTRRVFHDYLNVELARSHCLTHPTSLLLLDVDYLKHVNDAYGHNTGDTVLKALSERVTKAVREVDHVCRYGGGKLALILPGLDTEGALEIANKILSTVAAAPYSINEQYTIPVTVSIGLSTCPVHGDSDSSLISAATSAMSKAIRDGRNRVKVYTQTES